MAVLRGAELICLLAFSEVECDNCQHSLGLGPEVSEHHFCFIESHKWGANRLHLLKCRTVYADKREEIDDGHRSTGVVQGKQCLAGVLKNH